MEHGSRTRLMTALVLAAVFGTGVLVGFAADSKMGATPTEQVVEQAEENGQEGERRRRPRMYEQVGANDAQLGEIDSIIGDYRERMDALHKEFRTAYNPRYDALLGETRDAIKVVLSPEQGAAYQTLLDEYDLRRASDSRSRD